MWRQELIKLYSFCTSSSTCAGAIFSDGSSSDNDGDGDIGERGKAA